MASDHETIFTMEATPVKYGAGASQEAGWELKRLGVKRAMIVTDPGVAKLGHPERIKGARPDQLLAYSNVYLGVLEGISLLKIFDAGIRT